MCLVVDLKCKRKERKKVTKKKNGGTFSAAPQAGFEWRGFKPWAKMYASKIKALTGIRFMQNVKCLYGGGEANAKS
jgi:hypothetical protein